MSQLENHFMGLNDLVTIDMLDVVGNTLDDKWVVACRVTAFVGTELKKLCDIYQFNTDDDFKEYTADIIHDVVYNYLHYLGYVPNTI